MSGIGVPELVIILLIVLVLFGAKRLPGLASSLGDSIKEFRRATNDVDDRAASSDDQQPPAAQDPSGDDVDQPRPGEPGAGR